MSSLRRSGLNSVASRGLRHSAATVSVAEQIDRIPPATRPTVRAARRTVRAIAPQAKEIAYGGGRPRSNQMMWKLIRYAVDDASVVAIGTFTRHASLFFFRGRELEDGSGLLEGGGRELRYITLRAPADAGRPAVKRILRTAFKLGG
jgi:hypothetical protein